MKSTHFPSEIWAKIKSYEYQLIHSPKIEKIVHDLIHNAYMPYYLGMHEHKGGEQVLHRKQLQSVFPNLDDI